MEPVKESGGRPNDHLANERTFLAWIRTAIAIMAFGFVVVKFSLFVKQLTYVFAEKTIIIPQRGYSGLIGISLVCAGALIALLSFLRYKKIENDLNKNVFFPSSRLMIFLTIFMLLASIVLVLYLLPNI